MYHHHNALRACCIFLPIFASQQFLGYTGTNSIGAVGARHIAVGLTENQTLKTLVLAGNAIEDDGILALRDCLSTNRSLTSIDCRRVPHSAETAQTMWHFTQRSVDLHEKLTELDEMWVMSFVKWTFFH